MRRHIGLLFSGLLLLLSLPFAASADEPGRHPAYLHALSDLRAARWMLTHRPGGPATSGDEYVAVNEIDAAIQEIKAAAIDDGKNLYDHPPADVPTEPGARLHAARDILWNVHNYLTTSEDDPYTRQLRNRSLGHIDAAVHAADAAIFNAMHGR